MKVRIEFDGGKIQAIVERLNNEIDKAVGRAAERVRAEVIENLDRNGTNNTGDLRKSIVTKREAFGKWLIQVGELYGVFVEYGTDPHFPPPNELEKWVVRKLGLKGKEAKKAAWAIAKHIAVHGTKKQPFFRPAAKKAPDMLREELEKVLKEVG